MKVSVIIPNYNRASLVRETIDNMLGQTWKDIEIIVVDDGSTDESLSVLESYGDRILYYTQPNQGVGAARNLGLKHARGEYIQFMDSDDLANPHKIENQLSVLEKTGADIVYGPWMKVRFYGQELVPVDQVLQQKALPKDRSVIQWHSTNWSVILQSCLFRRSILQKAGSFREDWKSAEDQDLFLKCLLNGARLSYSPDSLLLYRIHDEDKLTTTGLTDLQRLRDWASHQLEIKRLLRASPFNLDPLRWHEFRYRIWNVLESLERLESEELADYISELKNLLGPHSSTWFKFFKRFKQTYSGFRFRLLGTRYHRCFGTAGLSPFQLNEIGELGYRLPSGHPWLPRLVPSGAAS